MLIEQLKCLEGVRVVDCSPLLPEQINLRTHLDQFLSKILHDTRHVPRITPVIQAILDQAPDDFLWQCIAYSMTPVAFDIEQFQDCLQTIYRLNPSEETMNSINEGKI